MWWACVLMALTAGEPVDPMLQKPRGLAVVGQRLYVADSDHNRVVVFELENGLPGKPVAAWPGFATPYGIAADADSIVVADFGANRVAALTPDGQLAWSVAVPAPRGLAATPEGLLVAGHELLRIQGQPPRAVAAELTLADGWGLAVMPAGVVGSVTGEGRIGGAVMAAGLVTPTALLNVEGELLLLESGRHRLLRWTGTQFEPLPLAGLDRPLSYPQALAWSDGRLYLADTGNHRLVSGRYRPGAQAVAVDWTGPDQPLPEDAQVVVAFGDSITLGAGLPAADSYPARLQTMLRERLGDPRWVVLNAGVGGNTVTAGAARFERDVLACRPRYVLLGFGMNDSVMTAPGVARVPLQQFRSVLLELSRRIQAAGATPLLATITPVVETYYYERHPADWYEGGVGRVHATYNAAIREVAEELQVPLLDLAARLPAALLRTPENGGGRDGVHFTAAGAEVQAVAWADALLPLLTR